MKAFKLRPFVDFNSLGNKTIQYTLSTDHSLAHGSRETKPKKRKKSRYTDTLQVTNGAKETKTKVKSLKAGNLNKFINEKIHIPLLDSTKEVTTMNDVNEEFCPIIFVDKNQRNMELSNVDLKDIIESYHAQKAQAEKEEAEIDEICEVEAEEEVEELIEATPKNFKSKNFRTSADFVKQKNKSMQMNLSSYIELCIASGIINRGFSALLAYRHKYHRLNGTKHSLITIDMYNTLITGYAEKGSWTKVKEILKLIKEDNVRMTPQTYAGILECLGRLETTDEIKQVLQKYIEMAEKSGISKNDIMDKSKFSDDKREIVLSTIQIIDEGFEPKYTPPKFYYSNELVNRLNDGVKGIREGYSREFKQHTNYVDLAKNQIEIEMNGYVTVKNVAKTSPPTAQVMYYVSDFDFFTNIFFKCAISSF